MRRLSALALSLALAGCSHIVVLHDPLTPAEHNDLGVAYEAHGEPDLARKEYARAVRLEPGLAQGWINLGNVDAGAARWDRAERSLRRALSLEPAEPDALNNLAFVLIHEPRAGALDEAETLARRAVETGGPRDSIYRATLAEIRSARAARAGPRGPGHGGAGATP